MKPCFTRSKTRKSLKNEFRGAILWISSSPSLMSALVALKPSRSNSMEIATEQRFLQRELDHFDMAETPAQEPLGDGLKAEGDVGYAEAILRRNPQGIGKSFFLQ